MDEDQSSTDGDSNLSEFLAAITGMDHERAGDLARAFPNLLLATDGGESVFTRALANWVDAREGAPDDPHGNETLHGTTRILGTMLWAFARHVQESTFNTSHRARLLNEFHHISEAIGDGTHPALHGNLHAYLRRAANAASEPPNPDNFPSTALFNYEIQLKAAAHNEDLASLRALLDWGIDPSGVRDFSGNAFAILTNRKKRRSAWTILLHRIVGWVDDDLVEAFGAADPAEITHRIEHSHMPDSLGRGLVKAMIEANARYGADASAEAAATLIGLCHRLGFTLEGEEGRTGLGQLLTQMEIGTDEQNPGAALIFDALHELGVDMASMGLRTMVSDMVTAIAGDDPDGLMVIWTALSNFRKMRLIDEIVQIAIDHTAPRCVAALAQQNSFYYQWMNMVVSEENFATFYLNRALPLPEDDEQTASRRETCASVILHESSQTSAGFYHLCNLILAEQALGDDQDAIEFLASHGIPPITLCTRLIDELEDEDPDTDRIILLSKGLIVAASEFTECITMVLSLDLRLLTVAVLDDLMPGSRRMDESEFMSALQGISDDAPDFGETFVSGPGAILLRELSRITDPDQAHLLALVPEEFREMLADTLSSCLDVLWTLTEHRFGIRSLHDLSAEAVLMEPDQLNALDPDFTPPITGANAAFNARLINYLSSKRILRLHQVMALCYLSDDPELLDLLPDRPIWDRSRYR